MRENVFILIVPLLLKDALSDRLFFVVDNRRIVLVDIYRNVDVAFISQSRVDIPVLLIIAPFVIKLLLSTLFLARAFEVFFV